MALIEVARQGHIATVTLNRADRRNAVNAEMMQELERISREFGQDEQTRVVIFRAEGRDFSVGADLSAPPSSRPAATMLMRRRAAEFGAQLMRSMQEIPQPTICAVKGVATGAGGCITSACDFRIGSEDARIGYGEVKLGINLMWNAVPICVHLVGPARAKQMIMTGKLFDAATLERWGFLDQVVPLADLDADTHLHVSFDVDFLDPAIAPGVGTTVRGGPNYREAQLCMEMIADTGLLASLDIMELNPALDERNRTAELAVDLVESLFGKSTLMRK